MFTAADYHRSCNSNYCAESCNNQNHIFHEFDLLFLFTTVKQLICLLTHGINIIKMINSAFNSAPRISFDALYYPFYVCVLIQLCLKNINLRFFGKKIPIHDCRTGKVILLFQKGIPLFTYLINFILFCRYQQFHFLTALLEYILVNKIRQNPSCKCRYC